MASVDAAKPPSLSEQYHLKGKEKPVEEVKTPVSATVEESLAEAAAVAAESAAVVESQSATAADESSKTSEAASGETTESTPAVASTEATPATETGGEDESPASEEASESTESETVDDEAAAEDAPKIMLETAPADFRFPTTNQTRHCFTRYVEYHRCIAAKGDDAPDCQKFAKYYRSLCPGEWIDRWNEQRENGTFPGPL